MTLTQASKAALEAVLTSLTAGRYGIPAPTDLVRAVDATRTRFGEGQSDRVTADRVEAALVELKRNPVPNRRQLFVLAHALAQPVRVLRGNTVLEDPIGDRLLQHWEEAARFRQMKPSHWRGLFHSYLQAESGPESQRLREILHSSMPSLQGIGRAAPPWLSAVQKHQVVLGSSPCAPYVDELLAGETPLLDDLLERVHVPDASWFWTTLRQEVIKQVEAFDDGELRARIVQLLKLPDRIPNARDGILAAILARYAACVDRDRDLRLMEFALESWGSPQLQSNRLWLLAGEPARHMVCGWLAREDLEDFYRLCKDAREVDDRRLRFWLRFTEQMGYTHILLGSGIRKSRNPDIREFLASKGKRLGRLVGGLSTNNAILMQIGGWLFVEFSEKGNACYAFPISEAVVRLGQESYSLSELKPNTKSSARLLHMDGNEDWESKFLQSLRCAGIHPDAKSGMRHVQASRSPGVPEATQGGDTVDASHLLSELARYDVRVVDNRSKGGAIWAYPNTEPFHGFAQLRRLGMKFKAEKKGFYWP